LVWSSENYDDCIFKNMKSIGSDLEARERASGIVGMKMV